MKPTINFIGAGKLGKTIARLIHIHQAGEILGIANRSLDSSNNAVTFIGAGISTCIENLPPADITFITTSDDQIQECSKKLGFSPNLKENSIVLHCSGTLSSKVLSFTKEKSCFIASAHPMRSFAEPEISVKSYQGTYCAIEGDKEAIEIVRNLFQSIGSVCYLLNENNKEIYHAAGVFASNYLVTLCHEALSCLKDAGVDESSAMKVVLSLMKGTLNNLENTLLPEKSLTGPIKRGDTQTIKKHLISLRNPLSKKIYKELGLSTLKLSNLPRQKTRELELLLESCEIDREELHSKL